MAAEPPGPTLCQEAARCLRKAELSLRHFRSNVDEAKRAWSLIEAAHRLWPENPHSILPYIKLLLENGRADEAEAFLLDCLTRRTDPVSADVTRSTLVQFVEYLAFHVPVEHIWDRLEGFLSLTGNDSLIHASILSAMQERSPSSTDELIARFNSVAALQPWCPQLIARAALPLLPNRSLLPGDAEVRLLYALARGTFHISSINALYDLCVRHKADIAIRSIASALRGVSRHTQTPTERLELRSDQAARSRLDTAEWSFLHVVADPRNYIAVDVKPTKHTFGFAETPSFEVSLRNRSTIHVPLGSPGMCSNVVRLYAWTTSLRDSVKFNSALHVSLTSGAFDLGETIPPEGRVSKVLNAGADLAAILFDRTPMDCHQGWCFAVLGHDDDVVQLDTAVSAYMMRMLKAGADPSGEPPAISYEHPTQGLVLLSPVSRFQRAAFRLDDITVTQTLARLNGNSAEECWRALDLVRRLAHCTEDNREETRYSAIRKHWLPLLEPAIRRLLESQDPGLRAAAFRVMRLVAKEKSRSAHLNLLEDALRDPHWYVRFAVLEASSAQDEVTAPVLAFTADETDESVLAMRGTLRDERPGGDMRHPKGL